MMKIPMQIAFTANRLIFSYIMCRQFDDWLWVGYNNDYRYDNG